MKIPAGNFQPAQPGRQINQPLGDQMDNLAFHLQLPIDTQEAGPQQFPALSFDQLRVYDDIGQAAFVFQRDEDDAGCRPRPLTSDDDTGRAYQRPIPALPEFDRPG